MADPLPPAERSARAAELALGVLEGEERAAALRLKLADPGFAAEVEAWEARLSPLAAGFAEAPPPDLWPAIERRVAAGDDNVRQLRRWRRAAIGASALAASLLVVVAAGLMQRPLPGTSRQIVLREPAKMMGARLDGGENGAQLMAFYDASAGDLRIAAMAMPGHESRMAPELWVIPADGVPRSLGMIAPSGMSRMRLAMPRRQLMLEGATLAVTLEPREGAPHRAPSSAPVAAGKISTI